MVEKSKSFWVTLPGILTGIAAIIGAVASLYVAIITNTQDTESHMKSNPPPLPLKTKIIGIWFAEEPIKPVPETKLKVKQKMTVEYFENGGGLVTGWITVLTESKNEMQFKYKGTFEWLISGTNLVTKAEDITMKLTRLVMEGKEFDLKNIDGDTELEFQEIINTWVEKEFLRGFSKKTKISSIGSDSMVVKSINEAEDDKSFVAYKRSKHLDY